MLTSWFYAMKLTTRYLSCALFISLCSHSNHSHFQFHTRLHCLLTAVKCSWWSFLIAGSGLRIIDL